MSKPASVVRQAKAAEDLIKELNARPSASATPDPGQPPVDPQAAAPAAPAPAPAPSEGPAATAEPAAPVVDWKHKYDVLEGKYRAEIPQLREELQQARLMAGNAQMVAAQLQSRMQQPAAAPAAAAAPSLISDQERKEFGEDLIDVVGRRAREVVGPTVGALEREVQQLKQVVGPALQDVAAQKEQLVYATLDAKCPEWGSINTSGEFLEWLNDVDVFSGRSRREALTSAWNAKDASRVLGIFQTFQREDAAKRAASGRQPQVATETLIAPGQGRNEPPAAPGSSRSRVWSESEIRDFYDRVRRKRISADEYQKVSAEIAQAVADGRVRPDRRDIHANR